MYNKVLCLSLLLAAAAVPCQSFVTSPFSLVVTKISLAAPTSRQQATSKQLRASIVDNNDKSSSSSSSNPQEQPKSSPVADYYDAIVCGGGPAGLLTAIMLTQKYGPTYKIAVCEQRATIPPSPFDETIWNDVARFYLLGIGHRGQAALSKFGVHEDFVKASVQVGGRRDWQPGMTKPEDGRITKTNKNPPSRVLARDKLVGVLHEHLINNYIEPKDETQKRSNIDLLYGYQVEPIDFGSNNPDNDSKVTVRITKCEDVESESNNNAGEESSSLYQGSQEAEQLCDAENVVTTTTNFLIGADGAARTVANAMEVADQERYARLNPLQKLFGKGRPFRVTEFQDDNPRVYKSVPILLPADWPRGLNYSARSKNSRITLEALPSDDKGNLCALLLMKPDDELAQGNGDPKQLRRFFDDEFPQFGALVDDDEMERIAQKPASRLPVFRYVGPKLHLGRRTVVLGDAAHTVKPYYGLGCNTALEDVQILSDILDDDDAAAAAGKTEEDGNQENIVDQQVLRAVPEFSKQRAQDAEALVTISRNMDRPGKMFFVNFLLPIILDGIFHKMAPKIVSWVFLCLLVGVSE